MKQCMHCGRNYDGYDGDMMNCPYCGEYGGNSWVYGGNGQKHAFGWSPSSGGSSCGSPGAPDGGCAAVLGIIFLLSIAGPALSCLWSVVRFVGIVLICWFLIIVLILLWDKYESSGTGARPKKVFGAKSCPADASSSRASSNSFLPARTEPSQVAPSSNPRTGYVNTITVTDNNYYKG